MTNKNYWLKRKKRTGILKGIVLSVTVLSFLNSMGRLNTSDLNDLGVKTGYSNGYLIGTALLCLVIGFLGVIALAYISDQLKKINNSLKKFK